MLLTELLREDLIKVGLEAENKQEAISELIDLLVQQHEIPYSQRDNILEAVIHSETALGSGMECGVAVPHGQSERVEDLLCALGTSRNGVPFESRDGRNANIVVLLVAPKRNFAGEIRALHGIAHLLENKNMCNRITSATTPAALYAIIKESELESAEEKTPA